VPAEIWMVAAEAAPLAQAGGLGDVLRALPAALAARGFTVRRFLPAYGCVDRAGFDREEMNLAVPLGPARVPVRFLSRSDPGGTVTTLVVCEELFAREGIYGPPGGEYEDNARRFTLLCRAVCERARRADAPPGILHVHDWHAALVPLFVRFTEGWRRRPRTVLTIHNMGYQGRFGPEEIDWLSLPAAALRQAFHSGGIEDHGGLNFLKAGVAYADHLTTVSPTHAREILAAPFGWGLDGILRQRASDLTGILNGADYDVWDPAADPRLPRPYGPGSLDRKEEARRALGDKLGLPAGRRPLLGVVGRLVPQKGIDVLAAAAPALLQDGADLAVLGSGDPGVAGALADLQRRHPGRIGLHLAFDDDLAHLVVAGCDLLLVPSRYEPCGLVQMHALRYGTIPVVHRTGGLADTVRDERTAPGRGTGFVFEPLLPETLAGAVRSALSLRAADPEAWRALQRRAMAEDFSWARAAALYAELYRDLLGRDPVPTPGQSGT